MSMATVGRRSEPLTCDYELNWLWLVSQQFVTLTIITVFFLKILACLLAKNFRSEATSFLTNTEGDKKKKHKNKKTETVGIDRKVTVEFDKTILPDDATFKGYDHGAGIIKTIR